VKPSTDNPYRLLPSVEDALSRPAVEALSKRVPRGLLVGFVQELLGAWRAAIQAGELDADGVRERLTRGDLETSLERRVRREEGVGLQRVLNATGVVLHTGLGRAPVHPEAARAMEAAARGYGTVEVDRFTGERNQRDDRLSELLVRLTGAEAGIVVNNNAGAVLLCLSTFAQGKETIVSRGELVEIGGSFRMPDVMARAGTRLVEVGTTNRTRARDYREAAGEATGLLLKVHTSNFRVVGFTQEVDAGELGQLGQELGLPTCFDLGSGLLEAAGEAPEFLDDEPRVRAAVEGGVDVVTFSGDKLLGGPQAGLIVGRHAAIERMRKNPMYRALRLDKVTLAGLQRTLELVHAGRGDELPVRAMLGRTADELDVVARELAHALGEAGYATEVVDERSQPGSGSAPGVFVPTRAVAVRSPRHSASELASRLRAADPPVFARIQDDRLLLDPRSLLPGEAEELVAVFAQLARSEG